MLAANPETGEVQRCQAGSSLFFRKGTWHHVRAEGSEPLRVLEFFAPPPSQGTTGAYAAKQAYLPDAEVPARRADRRSAAHPSHSDAPGASAAKNNRLRLEARLPSG